MTVRRGSRRALVVIAAASLFGASCGSASEPPFSSRPPEPEAEQAEATPQITPDKDCDEQTPERSLRPTGRLDEFEPSGPTVDAIRERGILRAGVAVDKLRFGSVGRDGDIEGFDIEIVRLVADALLGTPDRVELIPVISSERINLIESQAVDLVVSTMTITCERWAQVNFSSEYYRARQRVLVTDETGETADSTVADPDLTGLTLCAIPGTTSLARLEQNGLTTATRSTWTGCLLAFQQDEVDGVSTDDTILAGLRFQDPTTQVVDGPFGSEADEPYGVASTKDDTEFTQFVNAVLEQARADGTWDELYVTWLEPVLGKSIGPPVAKYRSS